MAVSLTGDLTMYAVLANQTDVLGITLAMVGILLGVNRLIRIPGNLLAGSLNDRPGARRRPLYLLGLTLGILSTLSYGMVRGFWPLLGGRLLWGISWALINVTGYTMVLDWSAPVDRGRMTGFYQMAFMLGLAISPLLGGLLTDVVGFRAAVRLCAAVSGAGLLLALLALPETRQVGAETQPTISARSWHLHPMARISAWQKGLRDGLSGILRSPMAQADLRILRAGCIYLVTLFVSSGIMMSTLSLYLRQRMGESISLNGVVVGVASLAGIMLAIRALAGMLAGPLSGTVSDFLPSRWPVIRGGILLGVAGFAVLAMPVRVWAAAVGVVLVALSAGALATALYAVVGDLAIPAQKGRTMGALATAGDIGSATGPFVAYALIATLDLRWVYLLCALALALALLATVGRGK
jgi:MFS family permease